MGMWTRLLEGARHAARKAGLWPWMVVEQEDLHGGWLTLTWSAWLLPTRAIHLYLGPNVGDVEVSWVWKWLEGQSATSRLAFFQGMSHAAALQVAVEQRRLRAAALRGPDDANSVAS